MFAQIGYWICVPFSALIRLFYNLTGSYGVALILFTLVIKLILLPFQMKSKKSMMRMGRMSGRMQELQKQYKGNQQKYTEEVQKLYAEEGVNPMGGCLWSFLPMPILIALYSIIRQPITYFMMLPQETVNKAIDALSAMGQTILGLKGGTVATTFSDLGAYGQIELVNKINTHLPEFGNSIDGWINVNYSFLGLDLAATPSQHMGSFAFSWAWIGLMLIPILSGALSFFMSKISMSHSPTPEGAAGGSTKMMLYMMPLMSVYIGFIMPAALGVYWIAQSGFSIIQEFFMGKFYNKKLQAEEDAREEARAADRHRRQEEAKKLADEQRSIGAANQVKDSKKIAAKRLEKQAQKASQKPKTNENGRVGDRPYARGRTFSDDHYSD